MNRLALSVCTLGVLCATSITKADVVVAQWFAFNLYHVKLAHMIDFDQRRRSDVGIPSLPGNGGMYCVPTATMNLICYAANHGFPLLNPGAGVWQAPGLYNPATSAIASLGGLMATHAVNGTNGSGWTNGSGAWLLFFGAGKLTRTATFLDSSTTPSVNGMALMVATGSIVAFTYGRYDVVGSIEGDPVLDRTGGHAVTFVEAKRNASTFYLRYRDPADDGANTTQSLFVNKEVTVTPVTVRFLSDIFSPRTVHAINHPASDGKFRLIDGYLSIKPISCLSFVNTGGQYQLVQINPIGFGAGSINGNVGMGTIFGVRELEFELNSASALALVESSAAASVPKLRRFNLAENSFVDLPPVGLKRFVTGPNGRIYAHDGDKLYCYKPDGTLDGATSSIPVPTALAFDDLNKHVVILSVPERKITRLTSALAHVGTFVIPNPMPMAGDGSVIVNPEDQHILFITDATSQMGEVMGLAGGFTFMQHTIAGLPMPKALSPSDDGKVFASTTGGLRVLVRTLNDGWSIDTASPFHNLAITGRMASLRSRSNIDPALHDTPAWNNIDPDLLLPIGVPVADCLADLNNDNVVNGADIGVLLGAWGGTNPAADMNADGIVNGADMGILLGNWGPCP